MSQRDRSVAVKDLRHLSVHRKMGTWIVVKLNDLFTCSNRMILSWQLHGKPPTYIPKIADGIERGRRKRRPIKFQCSLIVDRSKIIPTLENILPKSQPGSPGREAEKLTIGKSNVENGNKGRWGQGGVSSRRALKARRCMYHWLQSRKKKLPHFQSNTHEIKWNRTERGKEKQHRRKSKTENRKPKNEKRNVFFFFFFFWVGRGWGCFCVVVRVLVVCAHHWPRTGTGY